MVVTFPENIGIELSWFYDVTGYSSTPIFSIDEFNKTINAIEDELVYLFTTNNNDYYMTGTYLLIRTSPTSELMVWFDDEIHNANLDSPEIIKYLDAYTLYQYLTFFI